MKPVKWGIISTANIGVAKVIPGMLKSKDIEIVAISSRKKKTAQEWAGKLGIPKAYGCYEEMLADPEIEAVYNPLPNHLHVPLTLAAASAGKHVLCEKPIAITAEEAMQLRKATEERVHRRGLHGAPRHAMDRGARSRAEEEDRRGARHPGDVLLFQPRSEERAQHGRYRRRRHARHRLLPHHRVALHLRCASPSASRRPSTVTPSSGPTALAGGLADFGEGRHLSFTVSTQLAPYQRVNIMGTKGRIEIEIPFNAPPDRPNRYFVQGMEMNVGEWTELPVSDQYQLQAEAFGRVIRKKQKPVWGVADAIQNMKILDAFFRSEKSRKVGETLIRKGGGPARRGN